MAMATSRHGSSSHEAPAHDPPNTRRQVDLALHCVPGLLPFEQWSCARARILAARGNQRGGFYGVMWLYYPVLAMGHNNPIGAYVEWWVVSVFRTVGPG